MKSQVNTISADKCDSNFTIIGPWRVTSNISLESSLAQHVFSSFMWAIVHVAEKDDYLAKKLDKSETSITQGDLFLLDYQGSLRSLRMENKLLAEIANDIQQTGLGSVQEAYMCIIPPLSCSYKLPQEAVVDYILKRTREHEARGLWDRIISEHFGDFRRVKELGARRSIFQRATAILIYFFSATSNTLMLREDQERTDGVEDLELARESILAELKSVRGNPSLLDLIQCQYFKLKRQSYKDLGQLEEPGPDPGASNGSIRSLPRIFSEIMTISSDELTSDKEIRVIDKFGWTPLHYAAVRGDEQVITKLLVLGADPNVSDLAGWTPMHYAIEYTNGENIVSIVSAHLKRRADTEIRGRDGMGPLHCAAKKGYAEVIRKFIRAGANVHIQDNSRKTPLHWAAYTGSAKAINILLEYGAYAKARDDYERTPLHLAALAGWEENVERFLGVKKLKRDSIDRDGRTPLHLAAIKGSEKVMRLLLDKNETMINTVDNNERTPLDLAIRFERENAAVLLSNMYGISNSSQERETFGTAILFGRVGAVEKWVARLDKKDLKGGIKFARVL